MATYDNCKMINFDGSFMAYVDKKKMDWYIKKNLAIAVDEKTFKLTFEPKGSGVCMEYLKSPLKNQCVCCGDIDNLTKHHIVPYKFRKQLPLEYKSHSNYDVVLLCEKCHINYEIIASKYWNAIISRLYHDDIISKRLSKKIINQIHLINTNMSIPEDRKLEILHNIQEYNKKTDMLDNVPYLSKPEKYSNIDYSLIFKEFGGVENFIISCRKHFLIYAKPKFISPTWVTAIFNVECIDGLN